MDDLVQSLHEAACGTGDGDMAYLLREAAAALEAAREEVERLTLEMGRLQQQYDERTACVIVHRGSALACSYDVRTAYSDERRRAERLAELLDQAFGYVPAGTLADQIHCALPRY
jgi:hypothetical protein